MRLLRKITVRILAVLALVLFVAALAGVLVVRSGWFREYVRTQILLVLERGTGGRAELGEFSFDWKRMTAQVSSLVVHGKESSEEQPFLHVGSVTIGLRVISAIERNVDLASATVVNPQVHIVVYPDGSTNVPNPGRRSNTNWAEQLVNLRVQKYDIRDGYLEYDNRKVPLNVAGENLHVVMDYQPAVIPGRDASYKGEVTSARLRVIPGRHGPIETGFRAAFTLDKSRIGLPMVEFTTKESRAELAGTLEDVRAPHGTFEVKATIGVRENVRLFNLPIGAQGSATFNGKLNVTFLPDFDFGMQGRVAARGLGYVRDRLKIEDATLRADVRMTKDRLAFDSIDADALNAKITGNGELLRWREFKFEGEIAGMDLRRAVGVLTPTRIAWSGSLKGPIKTEATIGKNDAKVQANLDLDRSTTGEQGVPVNGKIAFNYDQATDTIALGSSWFSTPMTRVDVQGTLGKALPAQTLRVTLRTTNPDDLLPAIAMVEDDPPQTLPIKLRNGVATADGTVTGQLSDPQFTGQVAVTNGDIENHAFDRFTAQVTASRAQIKAERATVARGQTEVSGSATITAKGGSFDDADITASLNVMNASVAELVREAGRTFDLAGTASATVRVGGSVRSPEADITADVAQPAAYGERFTRLRASVRYRKDVVEVTSGTVNDGPATVQFSGSYRPAGADWQNGNLTFDAATQNLNIARLERVAQLKPPVEGTVTGRVRGTAQVSNGELVLRSAEADIATQNVTYDRKPLGDFSLGVVTRGTDLQILATGKVRDIAVELRGNWTLEGTSPGTADIRFSRMSIATLHSLSMLGSEDAESHEDDVPMEGFVDGRAKVAIALRQPKELKAELTLETVQLTPKESQAARLGVQPQDIILRNEQPVIIDITADEATIRQARFTGRDTNIQATGSIPLRAGTSANVSVRGNINLILLQLANPNLLANGDAGIQATMRGTLRNPELNGRLDVKNASLYFNDLPNGFDNANGSILFDRNRATIEKLTAETGGGTVSLAGAVDFSNGPVYRLSAVARNVRVRWPEDLSTTFNANVGLSGTPDASTLSGTITLNRAAFNPRTDLGQLLAAASKPTPAPSAPNEYLRGLQFDVRIENSPNFGFETSLTRDVEAEVDLHLHGSPLRPSLLGQISVNQGEVQVFGNRYTINRGDVRFLNPVKIEPTFDMDLETRARGITVNVTFSGTMQQLKVNYGSDPPLQSSEIIALLAVGRDPTSATTPSVVNPSSNTAFMEAGGGLIGQAVSQQLSNRLQRFFGASRVKIDPTLTGVDNLPQARLTIEQQVSKDVTLTYITNLNRTQEQLVRVQWDLNRNWSAIAVRDPNGLFGIDFQYRKRF